MGCVGELLARCAGPAAGSEATAVGRGDSRCFGVAGCQRTAWCNLGGSGPVAPGKGVFGSGCLLFDDSADTVFVVWPGESANDLVTIWP
jgi:hypothetical protein